MRLAQTTATDRTKVTLPRGSSILLPCILTMLDLTVYEFTLLFYGCFTNNLAHAQTVYTPGPLACIEASDTACMSEVILKQPK